MSYALIESFPFFKNVRLLWSARVVELCTMGLTLSPSVFKVRDIPEFSPTSKLRHHLVVQTLDFISSWQPPLVIS